MERMLFIETPVGKLGITASDEAVTRIFFGREYRNRRRPRNAPETCTPETAGPLLLQAAAELAEYFAGTRREFTLPLAPAGTPFQQAVWEALRTISYGETRTYGQLAAAVGVYFNGLFSISVTCRKISPTTLLTNLYILTIINRDNYQRQLQGGNMTTENMKALLDACYQAKRVRELLPALPKGVSPSYIHYLDTIEELERRGVRVKVSDISDALNLPRPGVTRTVKEMEDKGYLKKIASEQDGRVTYLSITESGRQLSQVHNTEFFAQLAPLVADISDADAACTVQTIEKIYKIMSERKNSLEHR